MCTECPANHDSQRHHRLPQPVLVVELVVQAVRPLHTHYDIDQRPLDVVAVVVVASSVWEIDRSPDLVVHTDIHSGSHRPLVLTTLVAAMRVHNDSDIANTFDASYFAWPNAVRTHTVVDCIVYLVADRP